MAGWKRIEVMCPACKYVMTVDVVEINEQDQVLRLQMDCPNSNCVVHQYGEVITHTVPSRKEEYRVTIADKSPSHFVN